jgi:hypothetical protein
MYDFTKETDSFVAALNGDEVCKVRPLSPILMSLPWFLYDDDKDS